ncbi:hypothetical protein LMH73_022380 [Vibrio splendidus]|nr:hypothetical protein [Vibrio splendidus]MCC4880736.1 hypothetical protein [Vibrio splendidus]
MVLDINPSLSQFAIHENEFGMMIDIPSAKVSLDLDSEDTEHLRTALLASNELYNSANSWAQSRLRNLLQAHRILFKYFRDEGFVDNDYLATEAAFKDSKHNSLTHNFDDALARYRSAMVSISPESKPFIERINKSRKLSDSVELVTSDFDLEAWGMTMQAYKSLSNEDKKSRYQLTPISISNAGTLIGFVKPAVTTSKVMNLKIENVTIEIKGDDINHLYEAFLTESEFKMFEAGCEIWQVIISITKAVSALYTNLETIGYNQESLYFGGNDPIDTEALAEFLTEHIQSLSSLASLNEYVTKNEL